MPTTPLRILCTNDFIGSFFPEPTSYGALPGAAGLQAAVDRLRAEAAASVWIDTGDMVQGSALGPLSDGAFGFLALRELAIDAATVGNHELDWGLDHLRRWSRELAFPLLAANADLGFAPTAVLAAGDWRVGVVGVTYPHMSVLHPQVAVAGDLAAVVHEHSAALRDDGCHLVVLALHDGVDRWPSGLDAGRIAEICASLAGDVDVVLGGHTLGHWVGEVGGLPFVQPWPFGSQVGVADVSPAREASVWALDVTESRPWTGPGAGAYAALAAQIVGHAPEPLACAGDGNLSLAQAIADAIVALDPAIDATVVGDLWNQAPRDGTIAHLPAGEVSMAQVLRLTPLSGARSAWGGQLVTVTLPGADAERVIDALASEPYFPGGPPRRAAIAGDRSASPTRLAVPAFYAARAERAIGGPLAWEPCATTWRDALLHACAHPRQATSIKETTS